jgi:hypothetical protein
MCATHCDRDTTINAEPQSSQIVYCQRAPSARTAATVRLPIPVERLALVLSDANTSIKEIADIECGSGIATPRQ